MPIVKTNIERINGFIKIWLPWIFVNAIGCPVAFIVAFGIILLDDFDPTPPEFPVYESLSLLIAIAFAGLSMGLIIGSGQWLILRKWFNDGLKWVLMTGISCALGLVSGLSLFYWLKYERGIESANFEVIAFGLPFGFFNGVGQWIFFRHQVPRSGWWILATSLGWTFGYGYARTIGEGKLFGFTVMGLIAGILSGFLLVLWLSPIARTSASQSG